jgi:hypothetical protein
VAWHGGRALILIIYKHLRHLRINSPNFGCICARLRAVIPFFPAPVCAVVMGCRWIRVNPEIYDYFDVLAELSGYWYKFRPDRKMNAQTSLFICLFAISSDICVCLMQNSYICDNEIIIL